MATAMSRVPGPEANEDPLDSYSATVIRVAAAVTPHVAALEVGGTAGSARAPAPPFCSPPTGTS